MVYVYFKDRGLECTTTYYVIERLDFIYDREHVYWCPAHHVLWLPFV